MKTEKTQIPSIQDQKNDPRHKALSLIDSRVERAKLGYTEACRRFQESQRDYGFSSALSYWGHTVMEHEARWKEWLNTAETLAQFETLDAIIESLRSQIKARTRTFFATSIPRPSSNSFHTEEQLIRHEMKREMLVPFDGLPDLLAELEALQ